MPWSATAIAKLAGTAVLTLLVALGTELRALSGVREELHSAISTNMSLRVDLSDMVKAITGKDKEIDRLSRATCVPQSGSPDAGAAAERKVAALKPSER
jgi:hypothetical protein